MTKGHIDRNDLRAEERAQVKACALRYVGDSEGRAQSRQARGVADVGTLSGTGSECNCWHRLGNCQGSRWERAAILVENRGSGGEEGFG